MMEVEYRREMNRNYMVIRPEPGWNEKYTIRMLNGNKIQGLLPFQDKVLNGEMKYYYDITSKQPLSRVLEHRNMTGRELRMLMTELLFALRQMERFLLDEGQLCFQPDYIYVEPDSFKGSFCLIPGRHREFAAELCELSQYLLDHVNHSDGDAVVLAFSIFKECRKLNFGMDDIERCLGQQERSEIGHVSAERTGAETVKRERIDNFSGTLTRTETENGRMEYEESDLDQMKREEALKGEKGLRGERSPKEVNSPKGENGPAPSWRKGLALVIAFAVLVIPIAIFLLLGVDGLNRWKWILLAVEILLAVTIFFMLQLGTFRTYVENKRIKQDEYTDEEPWEVYFREEEEYENQESGAGSNDYRLRKRGDIFENEYKFKESNFNEYDSQEYGSDEMQTVLLSARPIYKECRRLIPLNGDPEIPINYFPFIIGKNKDLTDYCLNKPGVSRLHVKLEETADGYAVTDLNSTNGTMVAGVLLEANETVPLAPGSELTIAAERYRFQ